MTQGHPIPREPLPDRTSSAVDVGGAAAGLRTILPVLGVGTFCAGFLLRFMDPLLPLFASDFDVRLREAGQTVTWFSFAYAIGLFFFGAIGDRFGKLRVIGWACVACSFTTLGCAVAPDFLSLRIGRLLSGFASSGVMALAMAWVGDVVPYERRQSVLAQLLIGMSFGVSSGILVGGLAADRTISWRLVFLVLTGLYVAVSPVLLLRGRRLHPQLAPRPRLLARATAEEYLKVLRRPWARVVLLTSFLEGGLYTGALAFIPSHLHARHGVSLAVAGSVAMFTGLGGLFFALTARLFLVLGEHRLVVWGGALMSASLLVVGLAPTWIAAVPGCFLAGTGLYMLHSTLQAHGTQMAPEQRGAAMGAFSASYLFGQAAGVALFGRVVEQASTTAAVVTPALGLVALGFAFAARLKARPARA